MNKVKLYSEVEGINETLHKFDTRSDFQSWLMSYAEAVYYAIKDGDIDFLKKAVDDLHNLEEDLVRDFVIADHTESDVRAIRQIIDAAQSRIY